MPVTSSASPLRLSTGTVRKHLSGDNVLHLAWTTAAITRELGDLCQFPPVSAAATLLLVVFDTIQVCALLLEMIHDKPRTKCWSHHSSQSLQRNKTACIKLARRAASILLDIRDQVRGRWEDAPPSLKRNIRKFEEYVVLSGRIIRVIRSQLFSVLIGISEHMKAESSGKWHQRIIRRSSTEEALSDFSQQLDDAARSFQVCVAPKLRW
jgi:hypothetical protein